MSEGSFCKRPISLSGSQLDRVSCTQLIFVIHVLILLAEIGLAQYRGSVNVDVLSGLWHFGKGEGPR